MPTSTLIYICLIGIVAAEGSLQNSDVNSGAIGDGPMRQLNMEPFVAQVPKKGSSLCKECEKVVWILKKIIDNPQTELTLIGELKKVCYVSFLSGYKDVCLNMVNNVFTVIHELQAFLEDPTSACKAMNFCNIEVHGLVSASKRLLLSVGAKVIQDVHKPSTFHGANTCDLCVSSLNQLKSSLRDPAVVNQYQIQAQQICKYTGQYERTCNEIVEDYLEGIAGVIADNLCDPESVCEVFKLCDNPTGNSTESFQNLLYAFRPRPHLDRLIANMTAMQALHGFDIGCVTCKAAVSVGIKLLNNKASLGNLAKALTDAICNISPTTLKAGCYDFMAIYAKSTVQLTLAELSPTGVCKAIHACNSVSLQHMQVLANEKKSMITCAGCKLLSKFLAHELQQNSVQQDITESVKPACGTFPAACGYKELCESVLNFYMPYVVEDIFAVSFVPEMCKVTYLC